MGNASSHPPSDSVELLVHSFQLDADFDCCQLPCWPCRRRNAMFHPPSSLPPAVLEFLPLEEAKRRLGDLNKILHQTGFNPRVTNPCFLLALITGLVLTCVILFPTLPTLLLEKIMQLINEDTNHTMTGAEDGMTMNRDMLDTTESPIINLDMFESPPWYALVLANFLPFCLFFCLSCHFRHSRRRRLTRYVKKWNRSGTGVKVTFGGGGTTPRGVTVGSEFGGTYDNFYMAQWDPKGLLFKGYLHVFVNTGDRQEWCRSNGRPYVPPVPMGQAAYVPPAGYALVPLSEMP